MISLHVIKYGRSELEVKILVISHEAPLLRGCLKSLNCYLAWANRSRSYIDKTHLRGLKNLDFLLVYGGKLSFV